MEDIESISEFKEHVLRLAWSGFMEDRRSDIQDDIGMWKWAGDRVPLANGMHAVTIEKGMLSFRAVLNSRPILFSIWIQMGEIRVGYRIPLDLLHVDRTGSEKRLSSVYDGQPCQRIVRDRDAVLFDLIFKSGFADFDFMNAACLEGNKGQPAKGLIIADRIHDILVHTFIAVINELITTNEYAVRPGYVGASRQFLCEIKGDIGSFEKWAGANQVEILDRKGFSDGGSFRLNVRCSVPAHIDLSKIKEAAWTLVGFVPAQSSPTVRV